MTLRTIFSALVIFSMLACGDDGGTADSAADTSTTDSATDTGTTDTSTMDSSTDAGDATADAGCGSAMLDGPCTVNGAFCGGPCGDVCGFCNLLECRDGTWGGVEVGPAPCFDCGSERCQADVQYCSRTISGVPGGDDSFACADPPEDCRSMVTCACLMTAGVAGDCDEPNPGEVTVSIAAP